MVNKSTTLVWFGQRPIASLNRSFALASFSVTALTANRGPLIVSISWAII